MRNAKTEKQKAVQVKRKERGYTVLNILATLSLIGILTAIGVSNLKELNDALADASFSVSHFLRLARSRAMSQTLSVQVAPISSTRIGASSAASCAGTMSPISDLVFDLPDGAVFADTEWSVCFTQRGLASLDLRFDLQDKDSRKKTIEIALGGGVRIQ